MDGAWIRRGVTRGHSNGVLLLLRRLPMPVRGGKKRKETQTQTHPSDFFFGCQHAHAGNMTFLMNRVKIRPITGGFPPFGRVLT